MEQQTGTQNAYNNTTQERSLPPSIYHPRKASDVSPALTQAYDSAKNLYKQGEFQLSLDILENKILPIASSIQFEAYLLAALAASNLDNATESLGYLQQADKLAVASHPDNQNRLKETRASILEYFGNWLEVVMLRMDLTYNLPLNEGEDNQTKLWMAIQNLTQNEVDDLYQQQKPLLNGWLTISNILRDQSLSIEQQLNIFKNWQIENPNHPAALSPPQDFEIMSSVEEMAPKKIVLMLPMSGNLERASQAIVDGFFTTFYSQKETRPVCCDKNNTL